ncbi:MAG: hypothetical protein RMI91_00670 [Gemmatales bacterium]|nr:hypothetical protein [Gemmatales bacterium]MDW7993145.1 hypothetical protein [Gemmatales bacterium]
MTWFGKILVMLNSIASLGLLGAITWMLLEHRQFQDDLRKLESQLADRRTRMQNTRQILANLLKEREDGNRQFVWQVRADGKTLAPEEIITVREARRRVHELEHGGPGKISLADINKKLDALYLEGAILRDKLDQAQQETRRLGEQLARISEEARAILPAPDRPSPVEEMYQQKRVLELKIRDLEYPLNEVRQSLYTLSQRHAQLRDRERDLRLLEQLPPLKPASGAVPLPASQR